MNSISKLITNAIIRMLRVLGKIDKKYPKHLQDARRAEFKKKIDRHNKGA